MSQSLAVTDAGEGQEVELPEVPLVKGQTESAQRANSVPLASVETPPADTEVTQGDRFRMVRNRSQQARTVIGAVTGALSGPPVWTAAPASLADKRRHHHQAAGHFEAVALRYPRLLWGYLHLLIKMLLHGIDWVLESPPRVAVAVAFYFIVRIWI